MRIKSISYFQCQGQLNRSPLWRCSRPTWTPNCATNFREPALQETWTQWSLEAPSNLCNCDSVILWLLRASSGATPYSAWPLFDFVSRSALLETWGYINWLQPSIRSTNHSPFLTTEPGLCKCSEQVPTGYTYVSFDKSLTYKTAVFSCSFPLHLFRDVVNRYITR